MCSGIQNRFLAESQAPRDSEGLRNAIKSHSICLTMGRIFSYNGYMIERNDKDNYFLFLDMVRDSGKINMYGAAPYLAEEFHISKYEARDVLAEWMKERSC